MLLIQICFLFFRERIGLLYFCLFYIRSCISSTSVVEYIYIYIYVDNYKSTEKNDRENLGKK